MKRSSYFIKDKALFGSYPNQEAVKELEENGVIYFIDLTCQGEKKIVKYKTDKEYINYPIIDHKVPNNWLSYSQFILKICDILKNITDDNKIYVHCKGGHGRAGIVVSSILCQFYKIPSSKALSYTSKCHKKRIEMRDKWRIIGSPQTKHQKNFVVKFFTPLYFNKEASNEYNKGLSTFSDYKVNIDGIGEFPTAESAIQALKDPYNTEYVTKQKKSESPIISKNLGKNCNIRKDWDKFRTSIIYHILELKFNQNKQIKYNLLQTGLRPIIENKIYDNLLGKLLTKLRNKFYLEKN